MNPKSLKFMLLWLLVTAPTYAGTTGLPWEGPLTTLKNSITGPVAVAIGVMVIGVTCIALSFHAELSDIMRRISGTTLMIGGGVAAATLFAALFVVTGAVI